MKINIFLLNPEDLKLVKRFLSNSMEDNNRASKKFKKTIVLEKLNLKLLTWDQIAISQHHIQPLESKIQVGKSMFLTYFLQLTFKKKIRYYLVRRRLELHYF